MVDMGTAITLLMKKWADAHGLTVKKKVAEYISGANGTVVKIIGTTSMTLLLAPTLEIDVANVAICSGDFYQGLLGCNLLCRHNKALSATTITFASGWTNKGLLVGHRRRQDVLWPPGWSQQQPAKAMIVGSMHPTQAQNATDCIHHL